MNNDFEYIKISHEAEDFTFMKNFKIWVKDGVLYYSCDMFEESDLPVVKKKQISGMPVDEFLTKLEEFHINEWKRNYEPKGCMVFDGDSWRVEIKRVDVKKKEIHSGSNEYPDNWKAFIRFVEQIVK